MTITADCVSPVETEGGGDDHGTGLVEQPVRLRLTGTELRRRIKRSATRCP
jgi:hypothetical protein